MKARSEFRNRNEVEVAVLDALVDRGDGGMTVFELRASVDEDIDRIETALAELKSDDLIEVEKNASKTLIKPAERVVPDPGEPPEESSLFEEIRERLPF